MGEREPVLCSKCKKDVFLKEIVYNPNDLTGYYNSLLEGKEIVHIKKSLEHEDALYACGECETPLPEYGTINDSWRVVPPTVIRMIKNHKRFFGKNRQI